MATVADYAGVWQDFRLSVVQRRVDGASPEFAAGLAVIGVDGLIDAGLRLDEGVRHRLQRAGHDVVVRRALPYAEFALVQADGARCVSLVADRVVQEAVEVAVFGRDAEAWRFAVSLMCDGQGALVVDANPNPRMAVADPLEWYGEPVLSTLALLLGLLALPAEVVPRDEVLRPVSKGRGKPHPLAPATVLTLSVDPKRVVDAVARLPERSHRSPGFSFPRRATTVTNRHGTTFTRRATVVMKHLPARDSVRVAKLET